MSGVFDTKEEAIAHALCEGMANDQENEGFTLVVCICGASDPPSEQMESCQMCERTVVAPGGSA